MGQHRGSLLPFVPCMSKSQKTINKSKNVNTEFRMMVLSEGREKPMGRCLLLSIFQSLNCMVVAQVCIMYLKENK